MDRNASGTLSDTSDVKASLSARRAGIEILCAGIFRPWARVALRKESVDRNTNLCPASLYGLPSLSARRAWIEIIHEEVEIYEEQVALRKESVDRNRISGYLDGVHFGRSPQGERG